MKKDPLIDYAQQAHAAAVSQFYQDEPAPKLETREQLERRNRLEDLRADAVVTRWKVNRKFGRDE